MNILVTGGAGFIGSALVQALLRNGHAVVYLDNFSLPHKALQTARVAKLCEGAEGHTIDVTDFEALRKIFESHSFDALYHLAAKPGVRESITNPFVYAKTNYDGTLNIFELAHQFNIPHVIYASSSSVYGIGNKAPFREDADVDHPISVYASTKRAKELLAYTYAHMYGMNLTGLRFFTVYGPYGRPDMAPYIFTDKILKGEAIQIFNHGKQHRDFTYIDDVVAGLLGVLAHPNGYQIYNLGNDNPVELMDFVQTIEKHVGVEAKKEFIDAQKGDVSMTHADISKARATFEYSPTTSLDTGIKAYVAWHRAFHSENHI
jgi:UDP-glucuronate 4-epimerase